MKKRKYFNPQILVKDIFNGDVLTFSNDSSKFNDSENYLDDPYGD